MREVLIDHSRRRLAEKRDGGQRVTLFTGIPSQDNALDALALEQALQRLETLAPARAQVVELRFYGGLSIEEAAKVLDISPATVKRHWQTARVWLLDALSPNGDTAAGCAP